MTQNSCGWAFKNVIFSKFVRIWKDWDHLKGLDLINSGPKNYQKQLLEVFMNFNNNFIKLRFSILSSVAKPDHDPREDIKKLPKVPVGKFLRT